jgi:hypothetical protein
VSIFGKLNDSTNPEGFMAFKKVSARVPQGGVSELPKGSQLDSDPEILTASLQAREPCRGMN